MATERPIITLPSSEVHSLAGRLLARGAEKTSQGADLQSAGQIIKTLLADGSIGAGISIRGTDLLVDAAAPDGTTRRSVPLREAIRGDEAEYQDCRATLLADGHCTTGGGATPLYHLTLVKEGR